MTQFSLTELGSCPRIPDGGIVRLRWEWSRRGLCGDPRRLRERAQQQAQSINNEFQLKVRPLVEQVAKDKGYDLVLDSQVAYTINKDFDITRDVIVKADDAEKAKATAPAAPAAPPATPKP